MNSGAATGAVGQFSGCGLTTAGVTTAGDDSGRRQRVTTAGDNSALDSAVSPWGFALWHLGDADGYFFEKGKWLKMQNATLERWSWRLVYAGLLGLGLTAALQGSGEALQWAVGAGSGGAVAAGVAMLVLRARRKP